jgi:hypothetical protein
MGTELHPEQLEEDLYRTLARLRDLRASLYSPEPADPVAFEAVVDQTAAILRDLDSTNFDASDLGARLAWGAYELHLMAEAFRDLRVAWFVAPVRVRLLGAEIRFRSDQLQALGFQLPG